jgi:hypothetical protein
MNGLSKLGIFFATSFGIFSGLVFVYSSRFGSISDADALIEIYELGQPTDILSKDGKFYYSPSKDPFQVKAFIQTRGFFAATAIDGTSYPSDFLGKQKWVRVPYNEEDPFQKAYDEASVIGSGHLNSTESFAEENEPAIKTDVAGVAEDGNETVNIPAEEAEKPIPENIPTMTE